MARVGFLPLTPPTVWSRFSDQRLLERTSAIYAAALPNLPVDGRAVVQNRLLTVFACTG